MGRAAIFTLADDLHAYIVSDRLRKRHGIETSIVEVDRLHSHHACWSTFQSSAFVPAIDGPLHLENLAVAWWRRARADQATIRQLYEEPASTLINQDWRATLRGALISAFKGVWVSHPGSTEAASMKIAQLRVAQMCGFRVPRTLISNDPSEVRKFAASEKSGVVVKAVAGTRDILLVATHICAEELPSDETIEVCPATYQEYIPGATHLRVNVFGEKVFIFEITSEQMDWRPKLTRRIRHVDDTYGISTLLLKFLASFGLEMGVFDLKISPSGQPVFFELNPQGQFLFLEGISGFPIGDRFAEFLASRAKLAS